MARLERFYRLDQLLRQKKAVTRREIEETFEISRATFKRDLEYLRDRLDYPIVYDPVVRAYRLETSSDEESAEPLKRVPLDARDPRAILASAGAIAEVSAALAAGVREPEPAPPTRDPDSIADRIRVISLLWPRVHTDTFRAVIGSVVHRRRLGVRCQGACLDADTTANHELSPQRLTRYCNVWFVDAWCHTHQCCASVRIRAIEASWPSTQRAAQVDLDELEDALDARYGLYTSQSEHVAVLEFHPATASLIDGDMWDEAAMGERRPDGSYVLRIPYWEPRDLLPEILRLGTQVRVLGPDELRNAVVAHLSEALESYRAASGRT